MLLTEPLFSISLPLSLPLQQCHSKEKPFNLHLFSCSLIKSETRKKQKKKNKENKKHTLSTYSFFTSERNERREWNESLRENQCAGIWSVSLPSSSEALLLRTSNSGLPAKKGAFSQRGKRKQNKEEKVTSARR